jgi:hypothetical protein
LTEFGLAEFREAIALPNHYEVVDRVKDIVIRHLVSTDDRAVPRKTDYFNHSFVPDLVLKWRGESDERYVFLRPEVNATSMLDDIHLSRDMHPIYYSLAGIVRDDDGRLDNDVESVSREADSLVTDSAGLESLLTSRRQRPVVALATSAVLQGARGVFDEWQADVVSSALASGIDAASVVNAQRTGEASRTIEESFDAKRSSRLNRLLQAIWVGSGGVENEFPGSIDLSGGLDESAISYLLQIEPIDDQEFWWRIGRKLTLELLTRIRVEYPSPNFQMLVRSNLDVLDGRICRVTSLSPTLMDVEADETSQSDEFRWEVSDGSLALRGPSFMAYVAEHKSSMRYPETPALRTRFDDLANRVANSRIQIAELSLSVDGRTVSYSSESGIDPVRETRLRAISRALGKGATVQSVVTLVTGHSPLTCDFTTSTASGKTSASYPISDLIRTSVTLLTELSNSELDRLIVVTTPFRGDEPLGLF